LELARPSAGDEPRDLRRVFHLGVAYFDLANNDGPQDASAQETSG